MDKICLQCDKVFTPKRKNGKLVFGKQAKGRIYCSKSCSVVGTGTIKNLRNPKTEHKRVENIRKSKKGKIYRFFIQAGVDARKGIPLSLERRRKISEILQGIPSDSWTGFTTPKNQLERYSRRNKLFRISMFKRDSFTCQECGATHTELNLHHIKPWSSFPDLRYVDGNVVTLCRLCHEKTDSYRKNHV